MEPQLEQIRNQQKESWNQFSPGWKKWDDFIMDYSKPVGDKIIELLQLKNNSTVFDVASGTGEPGLSIASMFKNSKVISGDISEKMLIVAKENAQKRGITNFETTVCDICELPFPDNIFDAISCRFGFMFFPDMILAAKEMHRVLRPGGIAATAVWNVPEKNFWITAIMGTINRNMELTPPPAGAPGMFRCAKEGVMQHVFECAAFKNVSVSEVTGIMNFGTADIYWNMMTEVGAPIVAALGKATDDMKLKIKNEVYDLLGQKYPDGKVNIEFSTLIISGEK